MSSFQHVSSWKAFDESVNRAGPLKKEPDHHVIVQGKGVKGVWIPPSPELVVGEVKKWADQGNVQAVRVPGYWYGRPGQDIPVEQAAGTGEKVVYVIHGGGFIGGTASPGLWSTLSEKLAQCHPSVQRIFAVEYRLTTGPPLEQTHPFPTALIDALAGYSYLIHKVGFAPEDIIICGDSAGGNLALALVRYLVETRADSAFHHIPIPAPPLGLALLSPWCDLGDSHMGPNSSAVVNSASDYLLPFDSPLFVYARSNYCHILGFPEGANTSRYLSPASIHPRVESVSFNGFPKTFITYGDAELLLDQCVTLEKMMIADLGKENVFVHAVKDACHDIMLAPWWDPEYSECFGAFGQWLDSIIPREDPLLK